MRTMTIWNPLRDFEPLQTRLSRLFGRALLPTAEEPFAPMANEWCPLVDVTEDDKEYTVIADLPEVRKEDVKVTLENGVLQIGGERRHEKEETTKKYHRIERSYGKFERSFNLPENADTGKITAECRDGTLLVHLPKMPEATPKATEIAVT